MAFDISRLGEEVDLSGGFWIDDIEDMPGARLKVRSINYKPYQVATSGFYRRNRKVVDTDEGLTDIQPATGKLMAEHLLVDWDLANSTGPLALKDKGKAVKYSKAVAEAVLTANDQFGVGAAYRNAVLNSANRVAEKLLADTNEAAGN